MTLQVLIFWIPQRRRRHFKSGQAIANKRSLVHVEGGGVYNRQCAAVKATCGIKMYGCRCSPVGPRCAPDPPAEWLQETRTRRAKASLCGTPGPFVLSSHCLCSLRTRPTTRRKWSGLGWTSRTGNAASVLSYTVKSRIARQIPPASPNTEAVFSIHNNISDHHVTAQQLL